VVYPEKAGFRPTETNNTGDVDRRRPRENSTQRGNENFGAVLDSVGAVLVQCVRDVLPILRNPSAADESAIKRNIEHGDGVGWELVKGKEPSLSKKQIQTSLSAFRSTGLYLTLLKKGGLPEEFWHLYEADPITRVEAVAMSPKPAPTQHG